MENRESNVSKDETWQDRVNKYGKQPGNNQPKKPNGDTGKVLILFVQVAIGLAIFLFLRSCFSDTPEKAEERIAKSCKDPISAFVMSQDFVKQRLKSPTSAKFHYRASDTKLIGECRTLVNASFDSQNGFGAIIRSNYSVEMQYHKSSDNWSAHNLVIDN